MGEKGILRKIQKYRNILPLNDFGSFTRRIKFYWE